MSAFVRRERTGGSVRAKDGTRWPAFHLVEHGEVLGVYRELGGRALRDLFEQHIAHAPDGPMREWSELTDEERTQFLAAGWHVRTFATGVGSGRPKSRPVSAHDSEAFLLAICPGYSLSDLRAALARGRTPKRLATARADLARALAVAQRAKPRRINRTAVALCLECSESTVSRLFQDGEMELQKNPTKVGTRTRDSDYWAFRRWDRAVDPDNPNRYIYSPPSRGEVIQLPTRLDSSVADAA